ncbi:MAG TPA: CrcB family protein [Thermoanaerobaculia bacterium]|nr:CrcB family protein [Thermoanaerobaculia bacterium]
MTRFLLVCAGGALGSGARYLLTLALARVAGTAFPWGTLLANIIGCFALALIAELSSLSAEVRLTLMTGVLGGFTTYSAFNQDTTAYLRIGAWPTAFANVAFTLVLCFAAGLAGAAIGRAVQ